MFLRIFFVKLHFINDTVVAALVQHLDRGAVKDVPAGLFKIRAEASAAVADRPFMLRLILYFGLKAVGLHLGHYTGQPHNIWVIFVACRLEFRAELNIPFQPERFLKAAGCGSADFCTTIYYIPPIVISVFCR